MFSRRLAPWLLLLALLLAACVPAPDLTGSSLPHSASSGSAETVGDLEPVLAQGEAPAAPPAPPAPPADQAPTISVPLSVYIVDGEDQDVSSWRTLAELEDVYRRVNDIWAPAGIVIEVADILRLTMPDRALVGVLNGDFQPFFAGAGRAFDIPAPSLLNGFYARQIGGPNGIVPFGGRVFFVTDEPSVNDERVTAHELGHLLGLHHALDDRGRLMFPGTNGMSLTEEEIAVARYVAKGLLEGVRR